MGGPTPLWAPWRMDYILKGGKGKGCFFCDYLKKGTLEEPILHLTDHSFAVLNIFPYNSGHLMVVPKRHVSNLDDLSSEELVDFSELLRKSARVVRLALQSEGINIGMNLGEAAGAGVAGHVHFHVVPRWNGDTNFMPVLSETKVISEHLTSTYKRLAPRFSSGGKG